MCVRIKLYLIYGGLSMSRMSRLEFEIFNLKWSIECRLTSANKCFNEVENSLRIAYYIGSNFREMAQKLPPKYPRTEFDQYHSEEGQTIIEESYLKLYQMLLLGMNGQDFILPIFPEIPIYESLMQNPPTDQEELKIWLESKYQGLEYLVNRDMHTALGTFAYYLGKLNPEKFINTANVTFIPRPLGRLRNFELKGFLGYVVITAQEGAIDLLFSDELKHTSQREIHERISQQTREASERQNEEEEFSSDEEEGPLRTFEPRHQEEKSVIPNREAGL